MPDSAYLQAQAFTPVDLIKAKVENLKQISINFNEVIKSIDEADGDLTKVIEILAKLEIPDLNMLFKDVYAEVKKLEDYL